LPPLLIFIYRAINVLLTLLLGGIKMTQIEQNADLVLNHLTELNIDIEKLLPDGTSKRAETELNLSTMEVKNALRDIRRNLGLNTRRKTKMKDIKKYIIKQNYDFTKRMPPGTSPPIAKKFKVKTQTVNNAFFAIRKAKVLRAEQTKPTLSFTKYCIEENIIRKNPNSELVACNTIANYLVQKLPYGGDGMIFGTPTAFCASPNLNNNMFLTDNLKVAHALDMTTDAPPTIVIGTGVDPKKAAIKAHHWKINNTTSHFKIITDIVDRNSLIHHVTKLAELHDFCKVIIMTSGVWSCTPTTQQKWNLDLNFKAASEYLTMRYPNLHIIAMTTGIGGSYHYQIKHLNKGKEIVVEP
jgi:hypothetical protein